MRGFLVGALVLVALDLVLKSPAANVAGAFTAPTAWLEKWMSPAAPLIARPVPVSTAGASTSGGPVSAGGGSTNQLGESTTGACPPGFPPGLKCAAM